MEGYSILTTCFNDSKGIGRYLYEMISQTIPAVEIIVVDGGSKDDTVAQLRKYMERSSIPIRLIEGKRLNIAQGFNAAIKACRTDLFIISCIGNTFERNMAERLMAQYRQSKADVVYGRLAGIMSTRFSHVYNAAFMGGNKGIPCCSNRCVLLHKSAIEKNGYFLENFIFAGEDAEYYFSRCYKNAIVFDTIDDIVAAWEVPDSVKEFKKKIRAYTIADLQWGHLFRQFINAYTAYTFLVLAACIGVAIDVSYGIAAIIVVYLLGLVYASQRVKVITFASMNLFLFNVVLVTFYKIKYIKYAGPKYRVVK